MSTKKLKRFLKHLKNMKKRYKCLVCACGIIAIWSFSCGSVIEGYEDYDGVSEIHGNKIPLNDIISMEAPFLEYFYDLLPELYEIPLSCDPDFDRMGDQSADRIASFGFSYEGFWILLFVI